METLEQKRTIEIRERVSDALANPGSSIVNIQGPCAADANSSSQLLDEAHDLAMLNNILLSHSVPVFRAPIWKPRSNPKESWNGMETTHQDEAEKLISDISNEHGIAAIEIATKQQVVKYTGMLAFAWLGARNIGAADTHSELATHDRLLPLGVKNEMSGNVDSALEAIESMQKARGSDGAPIALIFRGGDDLQTAEAWEQEYLRAIEVTKGRVIVDVAHGGEMAHDPNNEFKKSQLGQLACYDHVISLAKDGHIPAGIMCEASNAESQVDPVIPFNEAVGKFIELQGTMRKFAL